MSRLMATTSAEQSSAPQCLHICLSSRSIKDDVHGKNPQERMIACRGGDCNVKKQLRINMHQCLYTESEIVKLLKVVPQDRSLAAQELEYIANRASSIMEECRTEKWLLKAVEIGDCPEHFVELYLDLYWSSNVLSLAGQEIGYDEFLDNLRGLWRVDMDRMVLGVGEEYNQSCIIKVHGYREMDRQNLFSEVDRMLKDRNKDLRGSQADLQLASILRDRNAGCPVPTTPPDLERHVKSWTFKFSNSFQRAKGGSSYVIPAWVYDKKFVLKMALKPSEESDIIKKEAKIMEKCRHPYTVAVVGCWEINSKSVMMMESMKCTLTELMKRSRTSRRGTQGFSPSKAIDLLLPVAKAVRFLHGKDKPIAHRDIKPDNIMCLKESGDATRLIDFGDSVEVDQSDTTCRYLVAGTSGYMAPEVRKCRSQCCDLLKADAFSFGMVFAELLTWESPELALDEQAKKTQEALNAQAKKILSRKDCIYLLERGWRPHIPDDVPVYVAFIIESCWRKSPSSRPGFGDICLMLQNAQFLLKKEPDVATKEALAMVSYTDSDGMEWPIANRFTLREMLNIEKETDSEGLLRELLQTTRQRFENPAENSRKRQKLDV